MSEKELMEQMRGVAGEDLPKITKTALDAMELEGEHKALAEKLVENLTSGGTIGDAYNLTSNELELIYAVAHSYYANKKYDKALPIFKFLTMFDHITAKWWTGLGATWQMTKDYENAVNAYAMATVLDVEDPKPQLQAGYCLVMLGRKTEAREALEGCVIACGSNPAHALLKSQAEALINAL